MSFEEKLMEWVRNVLQAHEIDVLGMSDTHKMVTDVDKIIADGFNRSPVIFETNVTEDGDILCGGVLL